MTRKVVFFGGDISRNYEDYLGNFLFEPFAVDLTSRINWSGVNAILELACGSGRLTGRIAEKMPADIRFTATDLNPDMISVARSKVTSRRVEWLTADMQQLPYEDDSFDLVICQFGIMLVPDRGKAMSEMFRVLKPGGKILFNVWTDIDYNKIWLIGHAVVKKMIGMSPIDQDPGPFSLADSVALQTLVSSAGFQNVEITTVSNLGEIESANRGAFGFLYGLPVAVFINKEKPEMLEAVAQDLQHELRTKIGDNPLIVPQKAFIVEAKK